jgi:hypothetical protein
MHTILKIFLSSRNNDKIIVNGVTGDTLTELRKYIKRELQAIKFLDNDFFDVRINEDFGSATTTDSYNQCLVEVQESDFVIALYNGAAGWAPVGIDLGICHAELSTALNVSTRKTAIIDLRAFFQIAPADPEEIKRNELFAAYIQELNTFTNPLKLAKDKETNDGFKEELLSSIKNVIYQHMGDRISLSNKYFNIQGDNTISLNWKKLKYSDRDKSITSILEQLIAASPDFSSFLTTAYSIPDNMSVNDARSFTGRPFLKDQEAITNTAKYGTSARGPIHFIGVYGNATELQVKNMIGFPDISAIREDFGIYVWEQNTHIQLIFLTDCKTPEAVKSNFLLFNNWCKSTGEYDNMVKRAEARYYILKAINEAKAITAGPKGSPTKTP